MVQESGGTIANHFTVLDVYRRYKQFKPQGIAELNDGGIQLAEALAGEIAAVVDGLISGRLTSTPAMDSQPGGCPAAIALLPASIRRSPWMAV